MTPLQLAGQRHGAKVGVDPLLVIAVINAAVQILTVCLQKEEDPPAPDVFLRRQVVEHPILTRRAVVNAGRDEGLDRRKAKELYWSIRDEVEAVRTPDDEIRLRAIIAECRR